MGAGWGFAEGAEIAPGRTAIRRLGGGARYEAYLAWDATLFAAVVVKIVRPGLVGDEATRHALAREARAARELGHPSLVRSFDVVLDGPRPHLVLEHLEGPRLSTLLRRYGPLPPEQALPLGLELCSVLHYLAAAGHVHLDVKPSNVVMAAPPRLIDLSVTRSVAECAELDHPVGTDAYLAPEQCLPQVLGPPGPPADIWALGVTLYQAICGERPFRAGDPDPQAPAECRWPQLVAAPRQPDRRFPVRLAEVVLPCLERVAVDRPSAAEVAAALEPLVAELPRPVLAGFLPRPR